MLGWCMRIGGGGGGIDGRRSCNLARISFMRWRDKFCGSENMSR